MNKPLDQKKGEDTGNTKSYCRVALIGASNWLGTMQELFRRAGISCTVLRSLRMCYTIQGILNGYWWRFRKVREYDYVHHIGGVSMWRAAIASRVHGKKPVWHWIGTDVFHYRNQKKNLRAFLYYLCVKFCSTAHLADSPELAEELKELGISARVIRLLPQQIEAKVESMPERFTVLGYWWEDRKKLYGGDILLKLAEEFPEIDFVILANTGRGEKEYPNVRFLGLVDDVTSIYSQSSVFIRIPEHDSLSAMVLEMLARGRYVIYNKPMEGVHYAENLDQAREALKDIVRRTGPNIEGANMVKTNFSLDKEALELAHIYASL